MKLLARRSNAMWDVLLAKAEEQSHWRNKGGETSEYVGTRKSQITLHGVPMYITNDHLGAFIAKYSQVEEVSAVRSRAGIATSDYEVMVIMTRKDFLEVPNVLKCDTRSIFVMVEDRLPYCWNCGTQSCVMAGTQYQQQPLQQHPNQSQRRRQL